MLYAKTPAIKRVGSFFDPSGIFKDFPGCGRNGQGKNAGVIHQQIITCNVGLPISRPRSLTTRPVANLSDYRHPTPAYSSPRQIAT